MRASTAFALLTGVSLLVGLWTGELWHLLFPTIGVIGLFCSWLLNWLTATVNAPRGPQVTPDFEATQPIEVTRLEKATTPLPKLQLRSGLGFDQSHELASLVNTPPPPSNSVAERAKPPVNPNYATGKTRDIATIAPVAAHSSGFAGSVTRTGDRPNNQIPNALTSTRLKRPPKKTISPGHYKRHERTPGFLYIAQNDQHRVGLYKMGYTTLATPGDRVKDLNKQHKIASDVGAFRHVFAVPTAASYLSEQALFDFLSRFRVAEKREFFYGPLHHFMEAMNAARMLSYGDASALNALYEKDDEANAEMPFPAFLRTPFVPDRPDGGGGFTLAAIFGTKRTFTKSESPQSIRTKTATH